MSAFSFTFGVSRGGIPIPATRFGDRAPSTGLGGGHSRSNTDRPEVLILGGVHGDEPEGVIAAQGLVAQFLKAYPYRINLTIVPAFNMDGVLAHRRVNSAGVDLNRNLPTHDWNPAAFNKRYPPGPFANSEPENQALTQYLIANHPQLVLSLHSWHPLLNINGDCRQFAEVLRVFTGYAITDSIGYPTPGCLGTYAGLENDWPTLTYEIERGLSARKIMDLHVPAICEALKTMEIAKEATK